MTTNPTRTVIQTKITASPTVSAVAQPITVGRMGSSTSSGAVMVSNLTPNNGAK